MELLSDGRVDFTVAAATTTNDDQRRLGQMGKLYPVGSWLHYLAISSGLTIMVGMNLALLTWLLSQLNMAFHHMDQWHLMATMVIDGNMHSNQISSPMLQHKSQLTMRSPNGLMFGAMSDYGYDWPITVQPSPTSPSLMLTKNHIQTLVDKHLTVRSAHNDRLLLLLNQNQSNIYLDQVQVRSSRSLHHRAISLLNGSAQLNHLTSWTNNTNLTITSYTNRVRLRGTRQMQISSHNENTWLNSRQSIRMISTNGRLMLNTSRVQFGPSSLRLILAAPHGRTYLSVGQLCLCGNSGRLFIAPMDGNHQHQPKPCNRIAINECIDQ